MSRATWFWFIVTAAMLLGCGAAHPEEDTPDLRNETSVYPQVRAILERRCAECHGGFLQMTEEQWIAQSYIVPGNLASSTLYNHLRGAKVTTGPRSMPMGAAQLPASELATLESWIMEALPAAVADAGGAAPAPGDSFGSRSSAALAILRTRCSSCHQSVRGPLPNGDYKGSMVPGFGRYTTDGEFVTNGLLIPGNEKQSWLLRALRIHGSMNKMPPAPAAALSVAEFGTLKAWVLGLD